MNRDKKIYFQEIYSDKNINIFIIIRMYILKKNKDFIIIKRGKYKITFPNLKSNFLKSNKRNIYQSECIFRVVID